MNHKKMDRKIKRDAAQVKKGLSNLVEDKTIQMNTFKNNLMETTGKAKDDLTTWVGDSASQLTEGLDKLTTDAKETIVESAKLVEKDVKKGLSQYNDKAQKVADMVPGGFSNNVVKYPWVAISLSLIIGFILGIMLKPARHSFE